MRYETPQDLQNEQEVIELFCDKYGFTYNKLPMKHACDFAVFKPNGTLACFAEVRCRSFALRNCKVFQIAYMKYVTGRMLADYANVPFIFIIRFTDVTAWVRPNASADTIVWSGHNRRKDPGDMETMLVIQPEAFKIL